MILEKLGKISSREVIDYLWRNGLLDYKLDALQRSIKAEIDKRHTGKVLILSSRQIGKSYTSVVCALSFCIRRPGSIVRILAPTLKQVSDIVNDNLAPLTIDAPPGFIRRTKSEFRWSICGSSLRLGSLERSHVDNARGGNADLIILEEGGFIDSESYKYALEAVIGPQLLRSGGMEMHISSPSEDSEHYLHTAVLPACEEAHTLFRYTVYDSPSISPRMIEQAIERCGGKDTESFRREYLAEIIRSESLMVIPEFKENEHVRPVTIPPHYRGLIAVDLGGSRDKTAGYTCLWDFERARMLVVNELFHSHNTQTSQIVDSVKALHEKVPVQNLFMDLPGQLQVDLEQFYNLQVSALAKDDRDAAINNLRLMFKKNIIDIDPSCTNLIGCLKSARYNNNRTDFLRTEKYGHADPIMALVYGARMIDRTTNPFPKQEFKRDTQLRLEYRSKEDDQLKNFASELLPWSPLRRTN